MSKQPEHEAVRDLFTTACVSRKASADEIVKAIEQATGKAVDLDVGDVLEGLTTEQILHALAALMRLTPIPGAIGRGPVVRFEVLVSHDAHGLEEYTAITHCDCGSSFGTSERWPTARDAILESQRGLIDHLNATVREIRPTYNHGTGKNALTACACEQCREHRLQIAMLTTR